MPFSIFLRPAIRRSDPIDRLRLMSAASWTAPRGEARCRRIYFFGKGAGNIGRKKHNERPLTGVVELRAPKPPFAASLRVSVYAKGGCMHWPGGYL